MLATMTGVSIDAIRLYEARGLVRAERHANGYRHFDRSAAEMIALIRTAQGLGFSLKEIGDVFAGLRSPDLPAGEVQALLTAKLADVDARIADLHALRGLLSARLTTVCPLGHEGY